MMSIYSTIIPWFIGAMAFILPALYVIIKKKPLVGNYMWLWVIASALSTSSIIINLFTAKHFHPVHLFALIFLFIIGYMFFRTSEKMFFGVNRDSFLLEFEETLIKLNLNYEQKGSIIKIKEPHLEMIVSIPKGVGMGQIWLKSKSDKPTFNLIIKELKKRRIKPNYKPPLLSMFLGIMLFIIGFTIAVNEYKNIKYDQEYYEKMN